MTRSADFWRERDAWYVSVLAKIDAQNARIEQSKAVIDEQRAELKRLTGAARRDAFYQLRKQGYGSYLKGWDDAGKYSEGMASRKIGVPKYMTFDPSPLREMIDIANGVFPELFAAYDLEMPTVARDAFKEWPVKTGLSKAAIMLNYDVLSDRFRGSVSVSAPYLYYIKEKGTGKQPHLRIDSRGPGAVENILRNLGIAYDKLGSR